ncbi:MAG: hypothetical protein ACWGMZ_11385 [Thermoguttaceae bacterium]
MVLFKASEKNDIGQQPICGNRGFHSAFAQLAHAYDCAQSAQCSPWEFAVELESLTAEGLTTSDLRWLLRKGYIEHAYEVTRARSATRKFQSCCNLAFTKRTCFVLTETGVRLAATQDPWPPLLPPGHSAAAYRIPHDSIDHTQYIPSWDRERHVLRVDGCIVKQFRVPSPSQEAILTAFEEEAWPAAIDDPLPPHSKQDQKRRLRNTIQSLNANQKNPLLFFRGDGSGERIIWELRPDRAEHLKVKGVESIRAA